VHYLSSKVVEPAATYAGTALAPAPQLIAPPHPLLAPFPFYLSQPSLPQLPQNHYPPMPSTGVADFTMRDASPFDGPPSSPPPQPTWPGMAPLGMELPFGDFGAASPFNPSSSSFDPLHNDLFDSHPGAPEPAPSPDYLMDEVVSELAAGDISSPPAPHPCPDFAPATHVFSSPHSKPAAPFVATTSASSSATAFTPSILDCSPNWGYREGQPISRAHRSRAYAQNRRAHATAHSRRKHQSTRVRLQCFHFSVRRCALLLELLPEARLLTVAVFLP
jgi:hypothetical protein